MAKKTANISENYKPLLKDLENCHLDGGYSTTKWFEFLIDDVLAQLGKRLDEPWDEHRNKRLFELSGLYADLVIKNPFTDILGGIYQVLSSEFGKKQLGQFFTPEPVATMMAQIQYDKNLFAEKEVVRICEPTVGSGVMLLSFLKIMHKDNSALLQKLSITGIDLDRLCVKMATAQVLSNNFVHQLNLGSIEMYQGNALGNPKDLELFFGGQTKGFAKRVEKVVDEPSTENIFKSKSASAEKNDSKGQMKLF